MLQPLTGKEMEYLVDSMSNEDLMMKQCTVAAVSSQNTAIQQLCSQMVNMHRQNYESLMTCLQQHVSIAPMQPQN
ncbi:MAG: hypothetical protein K0Q73_8872 [Paenibacillus sp.]|nr:hypothetical protein [Paenibacillus sp.]